MAKRTQSSQPRARRANAEGRAAGPPRSSADELPDIPEPGDSADLAQRVELPHYESITSESMTAESTPGGVALTEPLDSADVASRSMASEPSEADIRLRAYHRYLERGGTPGRQFDDWLEAERDLKQSKL